MTRRPRGSSDEHGRPETPADGHQPGPLPPSVAWRAVARCVVESARMLATGVVHWPRVNVGRRLLFADGTTGRGLPGDRGRTATCRAVPSGRVLQAPPGPRSRTRAVPVGELAEHPAVRGVPGVRVQALARPGRAGRYRGVYEWDGAEPAEHYARSLWRVLALVSEPRSIDFRVVPGLRRDEALADPGLLEGRSGPAARRLVASGRYGMSDPDVLVVGAGPTGLTLALQAHDHGADGARGRSPDRGVPTLARDDRAVADPRVPAPARGDGRAARPCRPQPARSAAPRRAGSWPSGWERRPCATRRTRT